jgi:putative restriction endonuclease
MDDQIRLAAFDWLSKLALIHGDVFPRNLLEKGFDYQGNRITLLGPQGIWKPQLLDFPISIVTTTGGPYEDSRSDDGFLKYRYRGTDPYHPANSGLREVMRQKKPLIYFFSIVRGRYLATWPVYIIDDDISNLSFTVALDNQLALNSNEPLAKEQEDYYRRRYLTANIQVRLHQRSFRERVIAAYQNQCALCKLKHIELLDAAHITPDNEERGEPIISNGLALCKIHHAAFDQNILGITPDYIIKVREDILQEIDGPMLKHGIQSLENQTLYLPGNKNNWPDKFRLEERFGLFLKAV